MRAAMSWSWWLLLSPPPPVTQATEPRPTSYGLGSLGKAREARRLPEVAGNSHCSPGGGGGGGPGAAPCSQLQPRTAGQPRETLLHGHTRSLLSSAWFEAWLRTGVPASGFSSEGRGGRLGSRVHLLTRLAPSRPAFGWDALESWFSRLAARGPREFASSRRLPSRHLKRRPERPPHCAARGSHEPLLEPRQSLHTALLS